MSLSTTTDHAVVTAAIDRALAADPVRGTVLGTLRTVLEDTAWAAIDDDHLAVRSGAPYPVTISGDWSEQEAVELAARLREVPDIAGVSGPAHVVRVIVDALLPDRPSEMKQRLFRCDDLVPPSGVSGSAIRATDGDRDLVRRWYVAFTTEAGDSFGQPERAADRALAGGNCWLWTTPAGEPVALAAGREPVFGSARIGPVYTPPVHRGHGYGSAVTAAATRAVLEQNAVPVLFTDLTNPTSNKIYRQLGYRPVEDRTVAIFN